MPHSHESYLDHILIDEDALQNRIAELGAEISADYARKQGIVLVCVLRGGVMFLCDLMRHINVPHAIDFLAVSSYGSGARKSTGVVRIEQDLRTNIEGRHVLIIEDIVDSGYTLAAIQRFLDVRRPASLKICTLLNKQERREIEVPMDYVGFNIGDEFVFGYGLDLDELYRNLPFIGVVKPGVELPEGF